MTEQQIPKLAAKFVEHQKDLVVLSTKDAQEAIRNMPAFIACACESWKKQLEQIRNSNNRLRLMPGFEEVPLVTDGKLINVQVHELIKDSEDFYDVYKGLDEDLNSLCLTKDQIWQFRLDHHDLIRHTGFICFLRKIGKKFCVVHMDLDSDGRVYEPCHGFHCGIPLSAKYLHRFVLPKLKTP